MKHMVIALAIAGGFIPLNTSCAKHKSKKSVNTLPNPTKYFVHGDPLELVKGASGDAQGLPSGAAGATDAYNNYELIEFSTFSQATDITDQKKITSQDELEDENNTSKTSGAAFHSQYSFTSLGDTLVYKDAREAAKDWPVFTFTLQGEKIVIKTINNYPAQSLHYSVKANGEAFSLLAQAKDESGVVLVSATFAKNLSKRKNARYVDAPENYYVLGDGIAVGWNQKIDIQVCGSNADTYKDYVTTALKDWSAAGNFKTGFIGKNPYTVSVLKNSRPFSDLNQNCVNFVDVYRLEDQSDLGVEGITIPKINYSTAEIINTNIFIFKRAVVRFGGAYQTVVTHEMGHAIGLGHAFSTDTKTAPASIMGYSGVETITAADELAIGYLYNDEAIVSQ